MAPPPAQTDAAFDRRATIPTCFEQSTLSPSPADRRARPEMISALKIPMKKASGEALYSKHLRCIAAIEELTSRDEHSHPLYRSRDVRRILPLLKHPRAAIRSPAAYHLNQYLRIEPAESIIARLGALLANRDPKTSSAAAQALRGVNSPTLRKRLLKYLGSTHSHTRKLAASIGSTIADASFLQAAWHKAAGKSSSALAAISLLSDSSLAEADRMLENIFDKTQWKERSILADILLYGSDKKPKLIEKFIQLLHTDRWEYRALALYALQGLAQENPRVIREVKQHSNRESHPGVQAVGHMIFHPSTEHFPALRLSDLTRCIRAYRSA